MFGGGGQALGTPQSPASPSLGPHSPLPVGQRCGSRLCQAPAIAPAACARSYSLCKSVNILFTISPIIIHYLSPNPVVLEISAAPEASPPPCWETARRTLKSPRSVGGRSTDAGAEPGGHGETGVHGARTWGGRSPAALLMALGSSRPLWGFLCSFLIISHQGLMRAAEAHGGRTGKEPAAPCPCSRQGPDPAGGMAAPSAAPVLLSGMGLPLPSVTAQ